MISLAVSRIQELENSKKEYTLNLDIKLKASKSDIDKLLEELINRLDELDYTHSFKSTLNWRL